jgi:hypothetical protein
MAARLGKDVAMRGWKVVAAASVVLALIALATPRRVEADLSKSVTNGLIIGGITAGVVATVIIVAILVEGNKEPEPELLGFAPIDSPRKKPSPVRIGCAQADGTRALLCW